MTAMDDVQGRTSVAFSGRERATGGNADNAGAIICQIIKYQKRKTINI